MPLYIMLTTASNKTHRKSLDNPDLIKESSDLVSTPMDRIVNSYAVLGLYDYILIVEARDNSSVARISTELSAMTGLSIQTLPALSLGDRVTTIERLLEDVTDTRRDSEENNDGSDPKFTGLLD